MRTLILGIMLALSLSACGKLDVSGKTIVEHRVNVDNLVVYFSEYCEQTFPLLDETQIEECADALVGEFLNAIN